MTQGIGSAVNSQILQRLTSSTGVNSTLAALVGVGNAPPPVIDALQMRIQNVAPDLMERAETVSYPAVNIYCEKLANALTEKSRSFSGTARVAVEVRHSHDRLQCLQGALELFADAIAQTLSANRGDWGNGLYYAGVYEISYSPVKQGGRNFVQSAKITLEIGVSRN